MLSKFQNNLKKAVIYLICMYHIEMTNKPCYMMSLMDHLFGLLNYKTTWSTHVCRGMVQNSFFFHL